MGSGHSAATDGKVTDLADAVGEHIRPGMALHLAFSGGRPNAAVMEIVRQFRGTDPGFELSAHGVISVQHALIGAGLVRRVVTSFAGENYPAPRPCGLFRHALDDGRIEIENWSMWSLTARLVAGALGIPSMPVKSLVGSSMEGEHLGSRAWAVDGDTSSLHVAPLRPDVVLVHGVAADPQGNIVTAAPFGEGAWGALAARVGVVATVEEIVSSDELRRYNGLVRIPGHIVRSVSRVPFGGHPYGLYNPGVDGVRSYVEDDRAIAEIATAMRKSETCDAWIDEWIGDVADHDAYLRKLGEDRLFDLIGRARPETWELEQHDIDFAAPATAGERQAVVAARLIGQRVRTRGHDTVLAGIGLANLSGWLAGSQLRETGRHLDLMAEAGMFGYLPRPGDPYVFANRNQPTCSWLTDVTSVLGAMMGGEATTCLGVLGAGQVDQGGNINSTYANDGRFLLGSGGANDIATCADETIVTVPQDPNRLVDAVPYITAPGARVRAIVTTEGVLERWEGDRFLLTRYIDPGDATPADECISGIVERTGWPLEVSRAPVAEPLPSAAELAQLRPFDPDRVFLG